MSKKRPRPGPSSHREYGPNPEPGSSQEEVNPGIDPDGTGEGSFTEPINPGIGDSKTEAGSPTPQPQKPATNSPGNKIVPVEVILVSGNYPNATGYSHGQEFQALSLSQASSHNQRPRITGSIPDPYGHPNSRQILALPEPGASDDNRQSGKNGPETTQDRNDKE